MYLSPWNIIESGVKFGIGKVRCRGKTLAQSKVLPVPYTKNYQTVCALGQSDIESYEHFLKKPPPCILK